MTALVDERLEAWCQALGKGDWDRFERRLAWDGLDLETVRPALGPVRLREGVPLPEWSELLAEALRLAPPERREEADEAWPAEMGFLDAEDPLALRGGPRAVRARGPREARQAYGCFRGDAFGSGAGCPGARPAAEPVTRFPPSSSLRSSRLCGRRNSRPGIACSRWHESPREGPCTGSSSVDWRRGGWRACSCSIRCWHVAWARSRTSGSRRTPSSSDGWKPTYPSSSASSATTARSLATSSSSNHRCRIHTAAGAASWR